MRSAALLPLFLLLGCTAELKEENNALLATIQAQERELAAVATENGTLTLRVHDLETEIERRDLAASLGMASGEKIWALLRTSRGEVLCELFPQKAPRTVENFVQLAEGSKAWLDPKTKAKVNRPLYDGTVLHRVIPEFMVQGGDPSGTGLGSPGFHIPDEFSPDLKHGPGTLSMANTGNPNTGGSQFFITEQPTPHLDGKHSAFGRCEPMGLIKEIARVPRDADNRPLEPVILRTVTIHRGARPL